MSGEILLQIPDPKKWVVLEKAGGMRINTLWEDPRTGASISIVHAPEGAGIPTRHVHASNQFMYCIEGEYHYLEPEPGLVLRPGSFYMNPKGNPHGPTRAKQRTTLIEIYDGPHYYELPPYHTKDTVGKIAEKGDP